MLLAAFLIDHAATRAERLAFYGCQDDDDLSGFPTLPCVQRAPDPPPGQPSRLLLLG